MVTIKWPKRTRPGTNVAADGSYRASALLKVFPIGSVMRFVIEPKYNQLPYLIELRAAGFLTLGVVANESFDSVDEAGNPIRLTYAQLAKLIADRYGNWFNFVQVGNEWDHISPSSWTLDEAHLDALLWTFWNQRETSLGTWILVLGGAVSGNPAELSKPDLEAVDAIAVHIYGQRPAANWSPGRPWGFGNAVELISNYAVNAPKERILITEYGLPTQDFGDSVSADYHARMAAALSLLGEQWQYPDGTSGLVAYTPFCWSDGMVDGYGIVDKKGLWKPQAELLSRTMQSFYNGNAGDNIPSPNPQGEIMAKFILGFEAKAAELGRDIVGDPLEDEQDLTANYRIQTTTKGIMLYSKKANKVHFIAGR